MTKEHNQDSGIYVELSRQLSKSRKEVRKFFSNLEFSDHWLVELLSIRKLLESNQTEFAMQCLDWLGRNGSQLDDSDKQVRESSKQLASALASDFDTSKDWVAIHGRLYRMLDNWPRDLVLSLIDPRYEQQKKETHVWRNFIVDWIREPQLSDYALWLWQSHAKEIHVDTAFHWLRQALYPVVEKRSGVFASQRDVRAAIQIDSSWFNLVEKQSRGNRTAILPYIRSQYPERLLELLTITLDVALFLDSADRYDSPPISRSELNRPSIEESSQTRDHFHDRDSFITFLLVEIRDTLSKLLELDRKPAWKKALVELNSGRWFAMHRLVMNALSECRGDEGLELIHNWLKDWLESFTAEMLPESADHPSAYSEYHHELWILFSVRSKDLIEHNNNGWKLIATLLAYMEKYFEYIYDLWASKYNDDKEQYLGKQIYTWLWAVEDSLAHPNLQNRKDQIERYRSAPERYGVKTEYDTFTSHLPRGGLVQYKSDISAAEFAFRIKDFSLESGIDYLLNNPPGLRTTFPEEGGIIEIDQREMLRELGRDYLDQTTELLGHPKATQLATEYLANLCYGIYDAVDQLPKRTKIPNDENDLDAAVDNDSILEQRISEVFAACQQALALRLKLKERTKDKLQLNGVMMVLTSLPSRVPLDSTGFKLLELIKAALEPAMFEPEPDVPEEPEFSMLEGKRIPRPEFERAISLAYHNASEPLMALLDYTGRLHNFLRKVSNEDKSADLKELLSGSLELLTNAIGQGPDSIHTLNYAAFTGVNLYNLMILAHEHESDYPAMKNILKELLTIATNESSSEENQYCRFLRYGFLSRGHTHSAFMKYLLIFYRQGLDQAEEFEEHEKYAEILGSAYLRLWINRVVPALDDSPSTAIPDAVKHLFGSKIAAATEVKHQMLSKGRAVSPIDSAKHWHEYLGDLFSLACECFSEMEDEEEKYLRRAMLGWVHTIPGDMSLEDDVDSKQQSPESVITSAVDAVTIRDFPTHDIGRLIESMVERGIANASEAPVSCRLIAVALSKCKEIYEKSDEQALLPFWSIQEIWKLIDHIEADQDMADLKPVAEQFKAILVDLGMKR